MNRFLAAETIRRFRPSVTVFTGPMESGKTYRLIREVQMLCAHKDPLGESGAVGQTQAYDNIAFLRPKLDTRTPPAIVQSRDGAFLSGVTVTHSLDPIAETVRPNSLVAVDEAQFFDESLIRLYEKMSTMEDCTLLVAGLDLDFRRQPFGHIKELVRRVMDSPAEGHVHLLRASCHHPTNTAPAPFSRRLVASDDQIVIGGAEIYAPSCPKHFCVLSRCS